MSSIFFLTSLGWVADAFSACVPDSRGFQTIAFRYSGGAISVPRDAPVGTVFATLEGVESHAGGLWCTEGVYDRQTRGAVPGVINNNIPDTSGINGVYILPGAGFGYRLIGARGDVYVDRHDTYTVPSCPGGPTDACAGLYTQVVPAPRLQLVKTSAQIPATSLSAQLLYRWQIEFMLMTRFFLNSRITIAPQTCQVATPSIVVPMGSLKSSTFTRVGSTSPSVPFTLRLNCSGVAAKVLATFTDARNAGNTSDTLALTSASTAAGVGVQILRNTGGGNTPIRFGPDSAEAGNTNQIVLFTATGADIGPTDVALTARYIQTAATVTPGSANGIATFTMSYQ